MSSNADIALIRTGDLVLDLITKTVTVGGNPVHLEGKAYPLLELMSLRKDAVLTREMMLENLYGSRDLPEIKVVDIFINRLRDKIAHSTARIVETSHAGAMGFRLIGPPGARKG